MKKNNTFENNLKKRNKMRKPEKTKIIKINGKTGKRIYRKAEQEGLQTSRVETRYFETDDIRLQEVIIVYE